jgi:ATP phosphoribosyltransferase regulatory subunit
LPQELETALFEALQRKSQPDINALLSGGRIRAEVAKKILLLPELLGGADTLDEARRRLGAAVDEALTEVEAIATAVRQRCPDVTLRFDLCELSGYAYHTGTVFAAYGADYGHALARGGRYDAIGRRFGTGRPATGFDVNLKRLPRDPAPGGEAVFAPRLESVPDARRRAALWAAITTLRREGTRVISALREEGEARPAVCHGELVWSKGAWRVRKADG